MASPHTHSVPALVPHPLHCRTTNRTATLTPDCAISASPAFSGVAELLAGRLRNVTGWAIPVVGLDDAEHLGWLIEFQHSTEVAHPEGYILRVEADGAVILASGVGGAIYGMQSLLQLFPPAVFDSAPRGLIEWSLPICTIEDQPRFSWRGMHLDCSRHFQPVEFIRKFIDLLSQHKLNVFHWHLTDDQGWRLEILKYPRLTEVGSRRSHTIRGHHQAPGGPDSTPVQGYYTQQQVRELVAYAAARNVQILPEIDMPGHSQAAIAAYPELGMLQEPVEVCCNWGIIPMIYNVQPATIQFLKDVLDEVVELFPFQYVHIGGDEAVKTQWEQDAATQQFMRENGIKDEHHLQSWFIQQMSDHLQTRGRKLIGWEEILEGGLATGATIMSWLGIEGGTTAAQMGHDAIICAHQILYFDNAEGPGEVEPLTIGGHRTLAAVHGFEPLPADLPPYAQKHILGVQGQLWTEYMATPSRVEYLAFPRMCALAEIAWCPRERPDFMHFLARLKVHLRRLDCQDVRYRAPLEYIKL